MKTSSRTEVTLSHVCDFFPGSPLYLVAQEEKRYGGLLGLRRLLLYSYDQQNLHRAVKHNSRTVYE